MKTHIMNVIDFIVCPEMLSLISEVIDHVEITYTNSDLQYELIDSIPSYSEE